MMLFTAHNSGLCLQTLVLTHTAEVSRASQVASGEVSFSSQCHSIVPLSSQQPCYPKPFSLTLNTAFPFALQLSRAFFSFRLVFYPNCLVRIEENILRNRSRESRIPWSRENKFFEQCHHWLLVVVCKHIAFYYSPIDYLSILTKSLNKRESKR